MEQAVADQLGRRRTALAANSLSRQIADTNPPGNQGWVIGHWSLVIGHWFFLSALIVVSCAIGGCGSGKSPQTTVKLRELPTDAQRLSLVQFSPDGKLLASGGANGEVLVWRESNDPPMKLDSGRSSPLVSLTWSPDGLLAMTDLDRGFLGWQFGEAKPDRVEFPPLASAAVCIAFRPKTSDRELVLGMQDGSLIFVDKNGSKQLKPEHRGPVKQALYSLDGQSLVTAGADGKILWRDAATRQLQQSVKAAETDISRLLLSSDGKQLISGDWNGGLKVWDMATHKSLREFEQSEAVSGLGWVRGELVSGSWDGTLRGWEVSSGRVLRSISTGQPIHDLATDSGTSRVATVRLDRLVRVWDWQAAMPQ